MAAPNVNLPLLGSSFGQDDDQQTEEDLRDELQLQEIILDSLNGCPEDTPARRSGIQAEINTIKRKLKKLKSSKTPALPNPAPPVTNRPSSTKPLASMLDLSGYSAYNGSSQSIVNAQPHFRQDGPYKKRTYSTHLSGHQPFLPDSKSRRTTPSPPMNNLSSPSVRSFNDEFDSSSVIDLTGDDDEWLDRQKEKEEQFRKNKLQEERDAAYARQLQEAGDNHPSTSSAQSSFSGPNAFDLISNRPSQTSRSSQNNRPPHLAQQSSHPQVIDLESEFLADESPHSGFGAPSYQPAGTVQLPSHVKSESPTAARYVSTPGYGPGVRPFVPAGGPPASSLMPGSFVDDDDTDSAWDSVEFLAQHTIGEPGRPNGAQFAPATSVYNTTPNIAGSGYAQHPSIYQGQPGNSYGSYGPSTTGPSGYGIGGSYQRPGTLQNGSQNILGTGANGYRIPMSFGVSSSSGGLGAIINRTASYDYENGTDGFGNPLPADLTDLLRDFHGDTMASEEEIRGLLASIRPDEEIDPDEAEDGVSSGLKVKLMTHQKLALKWMESMEEDANKKGGILADDMGLGKTVTTLALMVSRRAEPAASQGRFVKTNLIVGPVSLIRQWQREIQRKVAYRHSFSVYLMHGKKTDWDHVRNFDIVLTTYGTLAAEHKKMEETMKKSNGEGRPIENNELSKRFPLLGPKSVFYRVILDEAQCIKNKNTRSARAAFEIKTEHRWCLSGTPMMNSVSELASLIQFLRIKPYCDPKKFQSEFGCLSTRASRAHQSKDKAMKKLQTLLKAVMLRRTKSSEINGKPIIRLPAKIEQIDHVVFDEDERQYYNDLEKESQVKVSKFLKAGTIGKSYHVVLVLLLRLRQACCHPYLHITDLEYGNNEIPEDMMEELARKLAPAVVQRIKDAEGFECPICYEVTENPSIMLPCGHDTCSECFVTLTSNSAQRNIQAGQEGNGMRCPQCRGNVDSQNVITYAAFKKVHMPETVRETDPTLDDDETDSGSDESDDATASEDEDETASEEEADDMDEHGNLKGFVVKDDEDDVSDNDLGVKDEDSNDGDYKPKPGKAAQGKAPDYSSDIEDLDQVYDRVQKNQTSTGGANAKQGQGSTRKKDRKRKGKKKDKKKKNKEDEVKPHMLGQLRQDATKNREAHKRYMRYLTKIWESSAKVNKAVQLVGQIQETGEKTIIFSQWTLLLDLLEVPLKRDLGIDYRRYDGGMSATMRDNAVTDFMEKSSVKVILVSLKAGNAGLNLTAASQIIIMDPFWNPYIEMQAVDRAYRMGQQREVKVHRILIEGTVEDRIVDLQRRKRELVDAALDEKAAREMGRLGVEELAYLFGVGSRR